MGVPVVLDQLISTCLCLSSLSLLFLSFLPSFLPSSPPSPFPAHSSSPQCIDSPTYLPTRLLPTIATFPHLPRSGSRIIVRNEPQHTLVPPQPIPNADATVPKLALRGLELGEGCGQVLQFLRELVLDVGELGRGEGGEVDFLWGWLIG